MGDWEDNHMLSLIVEYGDARQAMGEARGDVRETHAAVAASALMKIRESMRSAAARNKVPAATEEYNYYRRELGRLDESETYRLKVRSDDGETRWLNVVPGQLDRITEILAEGGE